MTYTRLAWTLLAIALLIVAVFESIGHGWVTAGIIIVFALLPDISLIGASSSQRGIIRPERVAFYNWLHQAWIPALLFFLGGLFLMTTLSVILQVASFKLTGKRIFRMAPLHHHFEIKGWGEVTIVTRFWTIAGLFAFVGLALFYAVWVSYL